MARYSSNRNTRSDKNASYIRKRQNFTRNPIFICIILIISLIFFYYMAKQGGFFNENDSSLNGELAVHFIDVGQGDSILIESPEGDFMLIDTGVSDEYNKLSGYLEHFKVNAFKYVIFTHPHADHMGSAHKIVENYGIDTLIMPDAVNNTNAFKKLIDAIENKSLEITLPEYGTSYQFGGAEFVIIAPLSEEYENINNYSVVLKMTYGNNKFLFVGDIEKESENEIIDYCQKNNLDISADVLKVAHHGSSTSSQKKFLDLVNPSIAVICCGEDNSYNHPNLKVVERIEKIGAAIYRTDLDGDIVITSDGQNLTVKKGREDAVNYGRGNNNENDKDNYDEDNIDD